MDIEKIISPRLIHKTHVTEGCKETIKKECYGFGYLDGYFDEVTYESYINSSDTQKNYYNLGYQKGVNDRLHNQDEDIEEYEKTKIAWLIELAKYDNKNGIDNRKISQKYIEIYNYYQEKQNNKTKKVKIIKK